MRALPPRHKKKVGEGGGLMGSAMGSMLLSDIGSDIGSDGWPGIMQLKVGAPPVGGSKGGAGMRGGGG